MGEDNVACSLRGKQVNLKMIAKEFIYSVKIKKHLHRGSCHYWQVYLRSFLHPKTPRQFLVPDIFFHYHLEPSSNPLLIVI